MITKPSKCEGCPFYSKGKFFTPDRIIPNSKVLFIAQNPGENEEKGLKLERREYITKWIYQNHFSQVNPQPLIGMTGQIFNNRFLKRSGLFRNQVSVANAIRCRPGSALGLEPNSLPSITKSMRLESSKADIVKALKHCREAYLEVPESVDLVVTMGRHAMFSLTGIQKEESHNRKGVMESWRGYGVDVEDFRDFRTVDVSQYHPFSSKKRIFFTMHIAALFRGDDKSSSEGSFSYGNKQYYHACLEDFGKIGRILRNEWPLDLPEYRREAPLVWPTYSSFDTEYSEQQGHGQSDLHRWSLCDKDFNLYAVENDNSYFQSIEVKEPSVVLIQNAIGSDDITHLEKLIRPEDFSKLHFEDLMLMYSVLWTGESPNLNYINSIYGAFNRYKHLNEDSPELYSALDAYEPMYSYRYGLIPQFKSDPQSWRVYKKYRLPLIQIIRKAHAHGSKIESEKLNRAQRIISERLEEIKEEARKITGDPQFNIGGMKEVREKIYGD